MSKPIEMFRKDMPHIARALDDQGWDMVMSRKGHIKFLAPTGKIIYHSGTPSDWRGRKNVQAQLRRAGLSLEPTTGQHEYVGIKDVPLPKETLEAMRSAMAVVAPDEFWDTARTIKFLGSTNREVLDFKEAGLLRTTHNPNGHPRGKYYLASEVRKFAVSEEFRTLRKTRGPRTPKVAPPAPVVEAPGPIEAVRMVVARRSMHETTLDELADALLDALVRRITGSPATYEGER